MWILLAMTGLWAFSFSLIGVYLAGQVDSWFSVLMRVTLAMLVFIPFMKFRLTPRPLAIKLMLIGACQLGIMYGFYYQSFLHLSVPEVLLFTVMTPIYIALINDILEKHFHPGYIICAIIAVLGAIGIRYQGIDENFIQGFLLVQGANLCFGLGQVCYKRLMTNQTVELPQLTLFGWFFIGAFLVVLPCFVLLGNTEKLPTTTLQWNILIYLGVIASGIGYFAWNKGATLVNVGALAVANNLLIPAGILVNVLFWNSEADIIRLAFGGGIILFALYLNEWFVKQKDRAQIATSK